jgi:hypothetical protein
MARLLIASIAAIGLGVQLAAAAPVQDDLCPELKRTANNPDGNRDCGAGCMPESDFGMAAALTALDEMDRDFLADTPPADAWEARIDHADHLTVLRGTLLQLQMEIAKEGGPDGYEAARSEYCHFLRDGARYLD